MQAEILEKYHGLIEKIILIGHLLLETPQVIYKYQQAVKLIMLLNGKTILLYLLMLALTDFTIQVLLLCMVFKMLA